MDLIIILFMLLALEFFLEGAVARYYFGSRHKIQRLIKKHHFSIWRYLLFFGIPFVTTVLFAAQYNRSLLTIFFTFAVVGTIMEWLTGYAYYNVVGTRLWTYNRYSLNGHTSLLSLPLWGFAGVFFWVVTSRL